MTQRLTGTTQRYAWGSTTFIPELLGHAPSDEPQAELWLGAHPSAPASVDGRRLDEVIAADPVGVVGQASVQAFGRTLPFLLKVLAADLPLSLQAHPSRVQAEVGYARELAAGVSLDAPHRIYKDEWPKPELMCALAESEALCGFRDPGETHALFEQLGVPDAIGQLIAPLADDSGRPEERLAAVFEQLLRLPTHDRSAVRAVVSAAEAIETAGDLEVFARTARELAEHHGDDPGVLAALLMNRITLQPNEAVFLPAGNLHAYLHGRGVEIMANSDNVMRGGLTPKHVDVNELMAILDFTPGPPQFVRPLEEATGCWRYPTPAPEFALWRLEPRDFTVAVPATGLARVLLVSDGAVSVRGTDDLALGRGQSAFARAGEDLSVHGRGTVFVAGPGVPA